jgi:hypothetical protein
MNFLRETALGYHANIKWGNGGDGRIDKGSETDADYEETEDEWDLEPRLSEECNVVLNFSA